MGKRECECFPVLSMLPSVVWVVSVASVTQVRI